ncbi:hypothetical protein [Bradyrhizobium erythrophlei]|uniref:Uncharacterized protein n=1 Tax=Bradyrhizobium erythrophlei TaxID=1437360 RepID=A0A1M5T814_9BRAD|nr:hypothetical protein [Bradyrhizobium erythrophlei]SHH46862.1 hypothetical protein SAMN05444169_7606 [Bradyrhizobium erythrophlei]
MTKVVLTTPASFVNDASAVAQETANNATLVAAFDNTVSRDGTGPNTMGADFDMNSHRILNLPPPASGLEPVRLIDVSAAPGLVGALAKINNLSDLANVSTAKVNLSLVKADVGLGNIDNTSDVNKPVSTAQAAADTVVANNAATATALKANVASPALTGVPTAPTPLTADNSTTIATTAYVKANVASGVTSIAGNAGAFTLGVGLTNAVNDIRISHPVFTNTLGADVALSNIANYFDGPSVAQGTVGTWFVSGSILVTDTVGAAGFTFKLWDGTTLIASSTFGITAANVQLFVSLSGIITAPAGNLRLSCRDFSSTSGKILFNQSGLSKDSTISAVRLA